MENIETKELKTAFYATFSQGFFATLTFSMFMVNSPILFDLIDMTKIEFSIGFIIFGICNVITNQLTTRFLLPKIGSTNCLIIARLLYAFIPFSIFYFSSYNFFIFVSMLWGISIGIQAPNIFTQVAIIEEKTKKILNPIFKSSFNFGFLLGAGISSLCLGLEIDPVFTTFIVGLFVFISTLTMYFFGLNMKYDVVNKDPRFSIPNYKIIMFASINMCIIAFMGIIIQWSPLWLVTDLSAPIFLVGSIVIFFNLGEIISNMFASKLITKLGEVIVGPCFAMVGSTILVLSIFSQNIIIIFIAITLFGMLISNVMPIVFRQAVKNSQNPIPVTISHVSSIAFVGAIFGPAVVGISAETFGLTFNMYALGVIMFLIALLMFFIMREDKLVGVEGIEPTPPK